MLNPLLASSARRRMRTVRTPLIITLYALLPLLAAGFIVSRMSAPELTLSSMRATVDWYIVLIVLQFFLIVLVAPAMTAGSISGEWERQTLELLLVTNTGSFRIVVGKLLESFGFLALVVLSGLPMTCVVLASGGLGLELALFSFVFLLVCAFASAAVGLFASALFRKTVASTVTAYLALFAIGVGTLIPLFFSSAMRIESADGTSQVSGQLLALIPPPLYVNPFLGLLSLLVDQTHLLTSTISSLGYGYAFYDVLEMSSFRLFTLINMAVMLVGGLLLTGLSALLVRPRSLPGKRKKRP